MTGRQPKSGRRQQPPKADAATLPDAVQPVAGCVAEGPRHNLLVAAGLIWRPETGELLVDRRRDTDAFGGLWEFPGGKIEPGEDPRDALRRELREELGLEVSVGRLVETLFGRYGTLSVVIRCYLCTAAADAGPRALEAAEVRWVPLARLDELPFVPGDAPFVARLAESAREGRNLLQDFGT